MNITIVFSSQSSLVNRVEIEMNTCKIVLQNKSCLGVLLNVLPIEKLSTIRDRMIQEKLFSKDFKFLFNGVEVSSKQETMFTMEQIGEKIEQLGHSIYQISIVEEENKESTENTTIDMEIESGDVEEEMQVTAVVPSSKSVPPPKSVKRKSFLRSPGPVEIKRMKLFSSEVIVGSVGKTRKYREYWNSQAAYLCRTMPDKDRESLGKLIQQKWREQQANLPEVVEEHPNVLKNKQRLAQIDSQLNDIQNDKNLSKEEEKTRLAYWRVERRRANDSLRKSLVKHKNADE